MDILQIRLVVWGTQKKFDFNGEVDHQIDKLTPHKILWIWSKRLFFCSKQLANYRKFGVIKIVTILVVTWYLFILLKDRV